MMMMMMMKRGWMDGWWMEGWNVIYVYTRDRESEIEGVLAGMGTRTGWAGCTRPRVPATC